MPRDTIREVEGSLGYNVGNKKYVKMFGPVKPGPYIYVTLKNTIMKQTTLTIAEAKRQIEELQRHIKALQEQPEEIIRQSIKEAGLKSVIQGENIIIEKQDNDWMIKIPLPLANTYWTFEAFEWMKKYITKQGELGKYCYPVHGSRVKSNHLHILVVI